MSLVAHEVYEKKKTIQKSFDVSSLNSGIYILKVMSDTQQKTIKLIKR